MLSFLKRAVIGSLVTCIVLVAVNASLVESYLTVPLFEVGSLWLRAIRNVSSSIAETLFKIPDFTNPWTYVGLVAAGISIYIFHFLFLRPLNRVRLLGDTGYVADGKFTQKDMVNIVRKRRDMREVPPVYPNGWFCVLESRDLKKEESKTVSMLGKTLAVFRGTDGTAYVMDAYCPHLGANLGVGGQVKGNCIECPFHGWLFRGEDGKCVDIPYCRDQKTPPQADIKSYTVLERNNFIYLWHHAEGCEPHWEPPVIDEIANGEWAYRGRTEHYVNCHIEDVPENGADISHLPQVHGPIMTSGIDLRYTYSRIWSFAKHHWDGAWTASTEEGEKHIGTLSLTHSMSLFGIRVPILDMNVSARQTGPGIVVLTFKTPVGNGAYMHHITPIEPLTQRITHQIYFSRFTPQIIPTFFLLAEALMIERDIMIWNNKKYASKPVYMKSASDSLLAKHRRWYSQFYSENSPRLQFQKDSMEW